jgi:hypothetical protein
MMGKIKLPKQPKQITTEFNTKDAEMETNEMQVCIMGHGLDQDN